jgi:hypothetical protein
MIEKVVIFDILEVGYKSWWFPCCGILLSMLYKGVLLFDERRKKEILSDNQRKVLKIFLYLSFIWVIIAFLLTYPKYRILANKLRENNISFIEGRIENFAAYDVAGRVEESFSVSGVTFSYKKGQLDPGYSLVRKDGGIIGNNMDVRIWYVDNNILRLEVDKKK